MLRPTLRGAVRHGGARLAVFFALLAAVHPAAGQTLAGTVLRGGEPVPGIPVELHRVTTSERGMVRRLATDAAGRFRTTLPAPADTGFTVYFATALANGVRYFGPPLHGSEGDLEYRIEVYDTTSSRAAADSVQALRRDVILSPAGDGGWEVAELVRLRNPGSRTLVPDRERPVVGISLPPGATAFEAGEGDQQGADSARAGELVKVGSRAWVQPPFVPGERDFVFRYRLPAKPQRVVIPVDRSTDSISVFLRQPAPDAEVQGLAEVEAFTAEGERFRRFSGAGLRPGASVVLDWRGPLPAPIDPRWTAVLVAAVILAAGGWLASRRRG